MDREGGVRPDELGCGVEGPGQVVGDQVELHHGRPADPPNSRRSLMMIDALAPATSVSAAHLANSAICMGRPSPLSARCSAHSGDGTASFVMGALSLGPSILSTCCNVA